MGAFAWAANWQLPALGVTCGTIHLFGKHGQQSIKGGAVAADVVARMKGHSGRKAKKDNKKIRDLIC